MKAFVTISAEISNGTRQIVILQKNLFITSFSH